MENFEKYATLSYTHSKSHHYYYDVLHNFIRAHKNNDLKRGHSRRDTYGSSEGGHYNGMAHAISSLDDIETKDVRNNITTSICRMRPS